VGPGVNRNTSAPFSKATALPDAEKILPTFGEVGTYSCLGERQQTAVVLGDSERERAMNYTPNSGEILTKQGVAEYLNCSIRTVTAMQTDGRIPKPFYLGSQSPRWRKADLLKWVEDLAAKSQNAEAQ
jgi:excisionase family DNA binding protein